MTNSQQLLAEYARSGSEAAFCELVTRYADLVYSVALRLVDGNRHLAEDISQIVFTDLTRVARTLSTDVMLGGWLHRHTCFVASKIMRGERRRQARERQAAEMSALQNDPETNMALIAPILDDAINKLGDADRMAIMLRFFEHRDFRSVGDALGNNEDAARMRVNRALEKLESLLKLRGITLTASALSVVLSTSAVQSAPASLAAALSSAALAGTIATTTATAVKTIAMTALQKALVTATVAVFAGAGIYEARQALQLRQQVQMLQHQQAPLASEIQQLSQALSDATNQIIILRDSNELLTRNTAELLKLRGEQTHLRRDSQELARLKASEQSQENDPDLLTAQQWLSRADTLKKWVEAHPDQRIPEFQYLRQDNWLDVVKNNNLSGDYAPSNAAYALRQQAKEEFAHEMVSALRKFVVDNSGELPTSLSLLNSYLSKPMNDELIQSYKLLHSGSIAEVPKGEWLVSESRPQEDPGHTHFVIGTNMWNTIR